MTSLAAGGAYGVALGQQVGYAEVGIAPFVYRHASVWYGTAASWVDLDPEGTGSAAYGTDGHTQVGYTNSDAALWNGTAASRVDLAPAGASSSIAYATMGGLQVGVATIDGHDHASLWQSTADSWTDLGAFLPSNFSDSSAASVWTDSVTIKVVGKALNTDTNQYEAIL